MIKQVFLAPVKLDFETQVGGEGRGERERLRETERDRETETFYLNSEFLSILQLF